jgi:hypothetical protein
MGKTRIRALERRIDQPGFMNYHFIVAKIPQRFVLEDRGVSAARLRILSLFKMGCWP